MSTDINTSTSNVSTSTLNAPTLVKRFGLIAMIAVLALLMGGKFSNALSSSPSVGGSSHSSFAGYGYGYGTTTPTGVSDVAVTYGGTSAGSGSIKVTWTNPALNGYTVTSYTVANPANTVTFCTQSVVGFSLTANSCTWTPTSAYSGTVDVFANYSTGAVIDVTGTASIKVASAPTLTNGDATAGSTPTVGGGTIKVAWTAPTTNADSSSLTLGITGYGVYLGTTKVCSAIASATSCTISNATAGLTAGNSYRFTVTATNAGGDSADSAQTASVVALNAPAAPTGVTATANPTTGKVLVSFTAPASNGGTAITGYTYFVNGVGSAVTCTATATSTSANPSCNIALTDVVTAGGTFSGFIMVKATTQIAADAVGSVGAKPAITSSANSNTISASGVPAGPGAVALAITASTATAATASWTAVPDVTGNAVQGYSVQLETCSSTTVATATCVASGSPIFVQGRGSGTITYNFTGLSYGKIYSVAVSAINGAGQGGISSIENELDGVTVNTFYSLATASAAPTLATAPVTITSYTNSSITATYVAPTALNGSTVTGYSFQLQSCASMTGCPVGTAKTATTTGTTLTWTGLLPNAYYQILETVTYTTAAGTTGQTTTGNSTTVTVGGPVTSPTITYTATGATVKWTAAATANTLSSYTLRAGSTVLCTATSGATSCAVTTAQLTAAYAAGSTAITIYSTDASGVNSAVSGTIDTLAAQTGIGTSGAGKTNAAGDTVITWDAASNAATTPLTYTVTAIGSSGSTMSATTSNLYYVFTAAKLTDASYTFKVSAAGPTGSSTYSDPITATTYTNAVPKASIITATSGTSGFASDVLNPSGNTVALKNAVYTATATAYATLGNTVATAKATAAAAGIVGLTPTALNGGGALGVTFVIDTAKADGNPIVSATGTLTIATGKTLVCTLPVANFAAVGTLAYGTCLFVGVLSNQSYTFSVVVNGAIGNSLAVSNTFTNPATSAAPTALTITDVSGENLNAGTKAKVSWTAPVSIVPITGYKVIVTNAATGAPVVCDNVTSNVATSGTPTYNSAAGAQLGANTTTNCYIATTPGQKYNVSVAAYEQLAGVLVNLNATDAVTGTYTANNVPATASAPTASIYADPLKLLGAATGNTTDYLLKITWPAVTASPTVTKYVVTASAAPNACTSTDNTIAEQVTNGNTTTITVTGSSLEAASTSIVCAFPSTSATTAVTFKVAAGNDVGLSTYKSPASAGVTAAALLAATGHVYYVLNATGDVTSLAWDAVTGATSYTVKIKTSGSTVGSFTSATNSFTIPAGTISAGVPLATYTYKVYTCGAAGCEATGNTDNVFAASQVPAVVTPSLYRTASTATTATLVWYANSAASNYDLPVTYTVYGTSNGLTTIIASNLTTTSYTIAGYSSLITYSVAAVNVNGANPTGGTAVTTATTFTAGVVPSAVSAGTSGNSNASVVVSATSVSVGFTAAPGLAGLADDTSSKMPYTVTATLTPLAGGTAKTCTTGLITGTGAATATGYTASGNNYLCTFTGLTSNTIYTYSVVATSQIGSSATPVTGQLWTTTTAPSAPVITSATSALALNSTSTAYVYSVTLNWSAPTTIGGAPVTGYIASVTQTGLNSGNPVYCTSVLTATATSCTFTVNAYDGSNAVSYSVVALNAGGPGTAATSIAVSGTGDVTSSVKPPVAAAAPAAPQLAWPASSMLSYPASGSITATWQAIGLVAGTSSSADQSTANVTNASLSLPITGYTCTAVNGGVTTTVTVAATATSCTFTGLLNKAYTVNVYANNAYALGATTTGTSTGLVLSSTATSTGEVSIPQVASAHANFGGASVVSGTITVQWIAPYAVNIGKSPIIAPDTLKVTSYTATATDAAGKSFTCTSTSNMCTITGLANSTTYDVTVVATTEDGSTPLTVSHVSLKTIAASAAAAPVITGAVRGANGLAITWTAPVSAGSGQLVGYFVTATDPLSTQQYTCGYNATYGLLLAPATTCSIAGLTVGNSYNISVTAVTKDGAGTTQLSAVATKTGVVYNTLAPEPVMATFLAVTAKQKSVSALSSGAKTSLASLISSINDGAQITITGYGTTKAIALARANAAANYLFNNGAAVHVTIKSVISKTIKTALVTVTQN